MRTYSMPAPPEHHHWVTEVHDDDANRYWYKVVLIRNKIFGIKVRMPVGTRAGSVSRLKKHALANTVYECGQEILQKKSRT